MVNSNLDDLLHGGEERRNFDREETPNPINGTVIRIRKPIEPFGSVVNNRQSKDKKIYEILETLVPSTLWGGVASVVTSLGVGAYKGYLAANGQHMESSELDAALTYVPVVFNTLASMVTFSWLTGFGHPHTWKFDTKDFKIGAGIGFGLSASSYLVGKAGGFIVGKITN